MPFDFKPVFQRALPYGPFLERYATPEQRAKWAAFYDSVKLTEEQQVLLDSFRRKMYVLCLSGPWCGDCVNACPIYQRIAEASPLIDLRFVNRTQQFDAAVAAANAAKTSVMVAGGEGPRPGTTEDPDDIRSTPIGKILVKWGVLNSERVDKALLMQEEQKAKGLNVRIGDVMTGMGLISGEQRDKALAAQSGYGTLDAWDVAVAKELSICGAPRVPVLLFMSEDWFECERFGERTLATYRDKAMKQFSKLEGASCPTGLFIPESEKLSANIADWLNHFERVQWMLLTSPRLMKMHGEV